MSSKLTFCVIKPALGEESTIFSSLGFIETKDHKEADLVVFTGGEDVHPQFYDEPIIEGTRPSISRDQREFNILDELKPSAIKVGICRGAQLLCVYHGGKLFQDVDGHYGGSPGHWAFINSGVYAKEFGTTNVPVINSFHHQQLRILPRGWEVVLLTNISKKKKTHGMETNDGRDIEAAVSITDRVFAFQAHPEFGHKPTREVFTSLFNTFLSQLTAADSKATITSASSGTDR